jgi:hypothetical protein
MDAALATARSNIAPCLDRSDRSSSAAAPDRAGSAAAPRRPSHGFLRPRRPLPVPCRCPRARLMRVVGRFVRSLPTGSTRERGPRFTPFAITSSCLCGSCSGGASTVADASL